MKKKLLFAAVILTALGSCTESEFVGEQSLNEANVNKAISFKMSTPAITRATGGDAASALDYKFKVYATKDVTVEQTTTTSNVFATGEYKPNEPDYNYDLDAYWVWYEANTANKTTSDTKNWEYVGAAGTHGTTDHLATITSGKDQTIKYWDYSADKYEFVAYSATVSGPTISKYQTSGFTVEATAAQLAGLYIADKLTINQKNNSPTQPSSGYNEIGNIVQFTFRAAATKVRLGIYETIPGYEVRNVNFRPNASEFTATTANAILSGSFNGTSSSSSGTYEITYNATSGIAEFNNTGSASTYFDFGAFDTDASPAEAILGTASTSPTWAKGNSNYQSVLPNTDNVANMILYVDYDLYNSVSGETIHVTGAKAVVPSIYMTWNPNYAYTYLFKISDNTNGTTGAAGSPVGLFPITFDAVTIAASDGQEVGIITTVSTPAITTYQNGSVSSSGITYANANGPIYITVNTDGTLASLSSENTKLYTVDSGTTEADLILTNKTKTEVASGDNVLSILSADESLQGISFASGTTAKFIPAASTTYAVEYLVSAATNAVYTQVTSGAALIEGNTYYTTDSGDGEFTATANATANASTYELTPAVPAVYQYKIIEVGANPVTP